MQLNDKFSYFMEGTNGKGILLVHGLTGAPSEMQFVAKLLHRNGYSVYAPLLAGHGADVKTLRGTRWQDWLGSVEEGAEALKTETNEAYAAGICVGGKLAIIASHQNPKLLSAAAIYSPCFKYDGWDVPFYYPLLSYNIGWLSRVPFLDRLSFSETQSIGIKSERIRKVMKGLSSEGVLDDFPGKGLVEMHRLGSALKKMLPSITAPTLVLHANEDDLSNPRNARIIKKLHAGECELVMLDNTYHMIHVDQERKKVAELTARFFEKPRMPPHA